MESLKRKHRIWIVNFHTAPPEYALNQRYIKMVPHLQRAGFDVTIISSSFLRRHNLDLSSGKTYSSKNYNGIPFIHIRTNRYKGNGIGRMLALFLFAIKVLFISKKFGKPNTIYHNIHVPFDFPVYFAARRFKATYIAEAWDLWPEFFHRTGLIKKNNPLMKLAYRIEKYTYTKAKAIVFTLEGGKDYIIEKRWDLSNKGTIDLDKIHYINNGIDLQQFEKDRETFNAKDPDLRDESYKVVYIGSMHKANDMLQVIRAAEILENNNSIKFFLYGDGSERVALIEYCKNKHLKNVYFKDKYVPFNHLPAILSQSALNILNYQKNFGDYGISAGKLFLYLAAGKPILSNVEINYCVIKKHNLGIAKDLNSPKEYANAILRMKMLSEKEYTEMCDRVKQVSKSFDYNVLSVKLIDVLNNATHSETDN